MDPYYISLLTNSKKCSSNKKTDICLESYSEITRLIKNIDNDEIMKNICQLSLEYHCKKQLTGHQIDIIIKSIKKLE